MRRLVEFFVQTPTERYSELVDVTGLCAMEIVEMLARWRRDTVGFGWSEVDDMEQCG
jgi:hypothetical protein